MSTPLADEAAAYAAGKAAPGSRGDIAVQRAFMAGALEALQRLGRGQSRQDLLREVIDYGRTVGRSVEGAR